MELEEGQISRIYYFVKIAWIHLLCFCFKSRCILQVTFVISFVYNHPCDLLDVKSGVMLCFLVQSLQPPKFQSIITNQLLLFAKWNV
jgi:hypothetical protein